ncbi:uncharacterized protein LOC101453562, partial [Ceratitis capitata]|uniref:uncharacterized protein LOC101453562 n=1 Tax=Ceratitis capitata TaxID=7213 RepID=UPI000329E208
STGAHIIGDGNTVSSLANVSPQVNAGVNLLNSVTQTVSGATGGGDAGSGRKGAQRQSSTFMNGANDSPKVSACVNFLNAISQTAHSAPFDGGSRSVGLTAVAPNNIGGQQVSSSGAKIVGDKNVVSSLINVDPQIGLGVNLLNQVTQTVSGTAGGGGAASGLLGGVGGAGNNVGGKQAMDSGASIVGSGNQVTSLLNLSPQLNVDVNALNVVEQQTVAGVAGAAAGGRGQGSAAGVRRAGNNIGSSQQQSTGARIVGDGNTVSSLANVNPQVNAGVNLLNSVTQTVSGVTGGSGGKSSGLLGGVLGGVGGAANNIGGKQVMDTGSTISGSGNQVFSLLNVNPQINADVNALNTIQQTAVGTVSGTAAYGRGSSAGTEASVSRNNIGGGQAQFTGARIVGDGNTVSSLANVNPQVNAGVNLLNSVTQTVS